MRLAVGDDVEKAYAAVYADDGSNLVVVHALTFKDASDADLGHRTTGDGTRRFHVDRTTVVVSGEPGGCVETVGRHIAEVIRR
jgi:hypothetical protein